jgi:Cu-Zn family superoxide dismutase
MGRYIALVASALVLASCGHFHKKDCSGDKCKRQGKCEQMGKCEHMGKGGMGRMMVTHQQASATMVPVGKSKVSGSVQLTAEGQDVRVTYNVKGLKANQKHGFHIHEFGDCSSADGSAAGGHFNPMSAPHGGPTDQAKHVGDLGNIVADAKGVASGEIRVTGLHLHMLAGRSLMVHAGEDDLKSQPAGNSGDRVACGIIGVTRL